MPEHLDCILETTAIQYALGIWWIYRGSVGLCGSTAGQFDLADPLRASWILRIHCFTCVCGSTAVLLDLVDLLRIYRGRRASWILRIHGFSCVCGSTACGPVGPHGSTADLLRAVRARWISCGSILQASSISRIQCGPVGFCGSTAGQLDLVV